MIIDVECKTCGDTHGLEVDGYDYDAWKYQGVLIQDAFPYLSADEREILISGICGKCFDNIFASCIDDEDEEFGAGIWE